MSSRREGGEGCSKTNKGKPEGREEGQNSGILSERTCNVPYSEAIERGHVKVNFS